MFGSTKTKKIVSTSVQPVYESHMIKNTVLDATIKAVLHNVDMPDTTAGSLTQSIGAKVNTGYLWAKNNYFSGVPQSRVVTSANASTELTTVFNTLYGVGHTVSYYVLQDINPIHYAWRTLIASYQYNPATNRIGTLTTSKGTPVYVKNIIPMITQASYDFAVEEDVLSLYDILGAAPNSGITVTNPTGDPSAVGTPYQVDTVAASDYIKIEYEYLLLGVPTTESFNLTITSVNDGVDTHQARVVTAGGVANYFSYIDGTGTYPDVDAVLGFNNAEAGTFLPFLYLRWNFTNEARNADRANKFDPSAPITQGMTTAFAKPGRAIPADIDQYKDAVKWSKFIGVNFDSLCKSVNTNPNIEDVISSYLNFSCSLKAEYEVEREYLYRYFTTLYSSMANGVEYGTLTSGGNFGQRIIDKRTSNDFSFSSISRTLVTGVVAEVGKYHTFGIGSYAKQISDTQYIVLTMTNPKLFYNVLGKRSAIPNDDQAHRIPIDRSILRQIGLVQREELLSRSMVIVFNTYIEVDVKWYQQEWFKIVMTIVAVVLTIASIVFPPLAPLALAAWAIVYTLIYILVMYIIMMVIQKVMEILIDALGLENTFLALVIIITVAVVMTAAGNGAGAATTVSQLTGAVLTQLPTMLASAYQETVAGMMEELQEDMEEFQEMAKRQEAEMKAKREEYGNNRNLIDGLEFVKKSPQVIWGESPDEFYYRSVHAGNMADVPYKAIKNYVKINTSIPTLKESLAQIMARKGDGAFGKTQTAGLLA